MRSVIKSDLYRYGGVLNRKNLIKTIISKPGFRYTYILRLLKKTRRGTPKWLILKYFLNKYSFKYGFQIPIDTEIGEGFYIGHHGTIVINRKTKIGKYCNIAHSTTIGRANRGRLEGTPIIGDKVWIGTGSVIVGNILIGNNVLIAPNSFVNINVPSNSIVLGNPCKIIKKDDPCFGYINNILT